MTRRRRAAIALLTVAALASAACGDDSGEQGGEPAIAEQTTTTALAPTTSTTTSDVGGEPVATGIGVRTLTLVDTSRPTPSSGDVAGTDERILETVISYPAAGEPADGAVPDAEPDTTGGPYPLVVFSHGLGGTPEAAQDLIDAWASAGFVVAAPRFPLSRPDAPAGADGGDVGNQPGDVSFLIDTLTAPSPGAEFPPAGMIDPDRVGTAGHSNGAITTLGIAANSCCLDSRLDAVVVMAGTPSPFAGGDYDWSRTAPVLVVHGTDDALISHAEGVRLFNELAGPKGLLSIDGGDHGSWFRAGVDGHDDVVRTTTDFLLAYLRDDEAAKDRLATEATDGPTTLRFAGEVGSTDTITTTTIAGIDRRVTVEPTTGLRDGSVVTVTWEGFTPGGSVNVVQCAADGVAGAGFCDLTVAHILMANPTGSGTVEQEVIVGSVGEGTCEPSSDDCVITVNDSGLTEPDATIRVPLEFAE